MIAISQSIASYLGHLGVASTVIYNGVASPELRPDARSHLGLGDAEFVVGGIGRIHEQKGWDVLCRAATMVRERAPEAEFVVVGDGPARQSSVARNERAPVRFVGYEPNASSLLGAFDVLAVPSRWEGFGRVAVEAIREHRSTVERVGIAAIAFSLVWIAVGFEVALLGAVLVEAGSGSSTCSRTRRRRATRAPSSRVGVSRASRPTRRTRLLRAARSGWPWP